MKTGLQKDTITFLRDLRNNNDRDWFNKNKARFVAAHDDFVQFVRSLIETVASFDSSVAGLDAKDTVFRIYRDIRFSRDKSPYKTHFGAVLHGKGTQCGVAGYYLHLQPGNTFLAGGVHMPEPGHLKAIRRALSKSGTAFLKIVQDAKFRNLFTLEGARLIKMPQGFDKEDPMAEYLKYKDLVIRHPLDDKNVLSTRFATNCSNVFKAMVPFNTFLNTAIKTNS
jgi:uncharacterized protein (TIGR02453 family)